MARKLSWTIRVLLVAAHWILGLIPWILSPVFAYIYSGRQRGIPKPEAALSPSMVEIVSSPASVLTAKIRKREVRVNNIILTINSCK